ncbi:MAG TPA: pyruvate, phosphate dikinase [Baekduia sp.]|nr:pyruvate, phosphate dikinase [Baekduia sp.]
MLPLTAGVELGREQLGGKAWGIAHMLRLGVPVPPAFVITTDECRRYHEAGDRVAQDVLDALPQAMAHLEQQTGHRFGGGERPLLVSVRSGAPTSMPGMMDTVLNLGITGEVQDALAALSGDTAFAADVARRFAEQFAAIVGEAPPADPWEQLHHAIAAVFASWRSRRAITYRKERGLGEEGGTAVTVQAMVFGNLDDRSGTGVLFTRNPLTGGAEPYGEWLVRGQGEDVVSGSHDPHHLDALETDLPQVHAQLLELATTLEREGRDVQDIEFTVQSGKLWLLQTRAAKRSAPAAVRLAVLLEQEGVIDRAEALDHVRPEHVAAMLSTHVDPAARAGAQVLATGRPASPGVVHGVVVTDVDEAEDRALAGEDVILARPTTNPDDVHAMAVVKGIVTEVGGATSHAAVVSRELHVACVVGVGVGVATALEGREVTVDADNGELLAGHVRTERLTEHDDEALHTLGQWARDEAGADDAVSLTEIFRRRHERTAAPA